MSQSNDFSSFPTLGGGKVIFQSPTPTNGTRAVATVKDKIYKGQVFDQCGRNVFFGVEEGTEWKEVPTLNLVSGKNFTYIGERILIHGSFQNGVAHGDVVEVTVDRTVVGTMVNGHMTGVVEITFTDGGTYTGEYNGTNFHGKGVLTRNDAKMEGTFDRNLFTKGKMTLEDGTVLEGNFKQIRSGTLPLLHGDGSIHDRSGDPVKLGIFSHGELTHGFLFTYPASGGTFPLFPRCFVMTIGGTPVTRFPEEPIHDY